LRGARCHASGPISKICALETQIRPTARVGRTRRTTETSEETGTPEGPWLRTGDLGAISDGELFIMGRIKDVVIIYGRNHYPDDIEATIQQITGGRVAAIPVQDHRAEKLVAIIEFEVPDPSPENALDAVTPPARTRAPPAARFTETNSPG
jgi:acyl-CoA synthetase (AMP-forming)/AMP-acid ligase II